MKILVYIEPHPIRNSMTMFSGIFPFLKELFYSSGVDVKIYANNETIEELQKLNPKMNKMWFIPPVADEKCFFACQMMSWDNGGIERWIELLNGGEIVTKYKGIMARIRNFYPFDIVITWGENAAVTSFCDENAVTKIAMERGCTRPPFMDSIVMDPYGTNGQAMVPQLNIQDIAYATNGKSMSAAEARFAYTDAQDMLHSQYYSSLGHTLDCWFSKNKKYAFLPLQLYDDANLLLFSTYKSIFEIVSAVVPRLIEHGYSVIIKPHPFSGLRSNANIENLNARYYLSRFDNKVMWCDPEKDQPSNPALFNLADVIITVNSSVGFEALYFDKVVVPLGRAIYAPQNLFPSLDYFLEHSFDEGQYRYNISILREFFLNCYLVPNEKLSEKNYLLNRIKILDLITKKHHGNLREICKDYYEIVSPLQKINRLKRTFQEMSASQFWRHISIKQKMIFWLITPIVKKMTSVDNFQRFKENPAVFFKYLKNPKYRLFGEIFFPL